MASDLLPPLTKDLTRYVSALQQVITEHDLHATSILRIRDACYCRVKGIDYLSTEGSPAELKKLPDYEPFYGNGTVGDPDNSLFAKYWAVETNLGTLLFSRYTDTGLGGLYHLQQEMEKHYFDKDFPLRHVRQYEIRTLNHNPILGTDAYYRKVLYGNLSSERFDLPADVFCNRAVLQDGVCVAAHDMTSALREYRNFVDDNVLDSTYDSRQIAYLLQIRESGWDSLDVEQRCDCRFAEHFRAVHFGAEHSDFLTDEEKASLRKCDRLYAGDLLKQFYPNTRQEGHLQVPPLKSNNSQNILKP